MRQLAGLAALLLVSSIPVPFAVSELKASAVQAVTETAHGLAEDAVAQAWASAAQLPSALHDGSLLLAGLP